MWSVACGTWPVTCGLWLVACSLGAVMCDYWAGGHLLQRNFEDELDVRTRQYHHKTAPNLKQAAAYKHAVSNWCGSAKAVSKTNPSRKMAADKPAPEGRAAEEGASAALRAARPRRPLDARPRCCLRSCCAQSCWIPSCYL